nr:hypothetical protein [Streptomyces abyssalis]
MSAHRRSLMTATAAGSVLCALWFVPSAKATPEAPGPGTGTHHSVTSTSDAAASSSSAPTRSRAQAGAADPGGDGLTTPFVLSALGLAGTGGALIVRARRRASPSSEV